MVGNDCYLIHKQILCSKKLLCKSNWKLQKLILKRFVNFYSVAKDYLVKNWNVSYSPPPP